MRPCAPAVAEKNTFLVSEAESGQKLFQCLARRLHDADDTSLHRWIRTGQVRVNGGRKKAFDRLQAGDEVRLPPFADLRETDGVPDGASGPSPCLPGLDIAFQDDSVMILNKPGGLPVHPGTGHTDSVTTRLEKACAGAPFVPSPLHRLDRDTSGLLVVARTYTALRALSDAFAHRQVQKEYLVWCVGHWPHTEPVRLEHRLLKSGPSGRERVRASADDTAKDAALTVHPLKCRQSASLLRVELHTGRTHQIRVQLAESGHPVAGDGKYGGKAAILLGTPLMLHAFRLQVDGRCWTVPPSWAGPWAVPRLPETS